MATRIGIVKASVKIAPQIKAALDKYYFEVAKLSPINDEYITDDDSYITELENLYDSVKSTLNEAKTIINCYDRL